MVGSTKVRSTGDCWREDKFAITFWTSENGLVISVGRVVEEEFCYDSIRTLLYDEFLNIIVPNINLFNLGVDAVRRVTTAFDPLSMQRAWTIEIPFNLFRV